MRYLLDTNTVADMYDEAATNRDKLRLEIRSLEDEDELCISILSHCELQYGYENAPNGDKERIGGEIESILREFVVLPLRGNVASHYGRLKSGLKTMRRITRDKLKRFNVDILLAATALEESCVLVSNDSVYKDLHRIISELRVENWLEEDRT
jgi:predicted nucleic acid-binding protein